MHSKSVLIVVIVLFISLSFFAFRFRHTAIVRGFLSEGTSQDESTNVDTSSFFQFWKRPNSLPKVAIQVGHWKNDELPPELESIKGNTGTEGGGVTEVEVNMTIAKEIATLLEEKGVQVDILPATVPPGYWADVFLSIHADGNSDSRVSGYKFSGPWKDFTRNANQLVELLTTEYESATKMQRDSNITDNMRGYYAFAWWRYDHAIHPMTVGIVVETGFLTNASDRYILTQKPELPAHAIGKAVLSYLKAQNILSVSSSTE